MASKIVVNGRERAPLERAWHRLTSDEAMDLRQWRERIMMAVFGAMVLFGLLPLITSLKMAIDTRLWLNAAVYLGGYILVCCVAFVRAIPQEVRAWTGVIGVFCLGALAFFTLGPHGSGRIYLYAASVLACLLLGLRASMGFLAAVIAFCVAFTYFLNTGRITWTLAGQDPIVSWNTAIITFLFLCVFTCVALAVLIKGLSRALEDSRDYSRRLVEVGDALRREMKEQRRLQDAVIESEERFKDLFESAPTAYLALDMDGGIARGNHQAAALLGCPADKLTGRSLLDFLAIDSREAGRVAAALGRLGLGGEVIDEELRMIRYDGEPIWVNLTVSAVRGEGRAIAVDITERKRISRALADSEQRFRQIFEESPVPLMMQDFSGAKEELDRLAASEGEGLREYLHSHPEELAAIQARVKVLFVNQATIELYQAGDRRAMEALLAEPGSGQAGPGFADQLLALCGGRTRFEWSGRDRTMGGTDIEVMISKVVMAGYGGDLSRVLTSITDLSDVKKAQREKELLESQLRQAQKMEAVGTLAGGIAHDFNNILAAIMGYAEIGLEKTGGGAESRELQGILGAAQRAARLVRQILTFSRRQDSELSLINVNGEVSAAVSLLSQILPKMIDIRLDLSDEVVSVMGDPHQIEQIVLNLGANARDAMPEGGVITIATSLRRVERVVCQATAQPFSGEYVVIEMSDQGQGIAQEVMDRIFDPFFTTKEVGKGTGLGLATVFGIVRAHGGHITCRSQAGQGTTFGIYLPPARDDHGSVTVAVGETESAGGRGERILLVDDEKHILEIGAHNLRRAGYEVLTAPSGEDALAVFGAADQAVDLVVLDMNMPGMGGHKCLQMLRALDPELKVVVASGYSREGDLRETLSLGAASILTKPFGRDEMLATVRVVLDA